MQTPTVKIGNYIIELKESVMPKQFGFVETGRNKWRNGFTELRKLGHRYTIRHTVSDKYHVTTLDDLDVYCKNFLRLNGY